MKEVAPSIAQFGQGDARDAMYEKFRKNDVDEPFTGAETLIELDGIPAVLTVADCAGHVLLANPDAWIDSSLLDVADRLCGRDTVRDALAQAAVDSPAIAAFVAEVEANSRPMNEASPRVSDLASASYAQVRQTISDASGRQPSIVALQRWGRAATSEELTLAAGDLMCQTNEDRLVSYVRIFGKRPFPLDPAVLLPLVRHPNRKLAAAAFTALSLVTDGRVRSLALDILRDPTGTWFTKGRALDLLVRNYTPDDAPRLAEWLANSRDRDEFRAIGFSALDVLQAHPTAAGVPALLALYEDGPCSNCRRQALELLHSLGAMPTWMLEEARFDARPSIRELAAALTTAR